MLRAGGSAPRGTGAICPPPPLRVLVTASARWARSHVARKKWLAAWAFRLPRPVRGGSCTPGGRVVFVSNIGPATVHRVEKDAELSTGACRQHETVGARP